MEAINSKSILQKRIKLLGGSRKGAYTVTHDTTTEYAKRLENMKRLDDILALPEDWNGYHAKPFSKDLVDKCKNVVETLTYQPDVYPTGRQSIQLQYQLEDESYLEFEIFKDKTVCLYVPQGIYEKAIEQHFIHAEEQQIKEKTDWFYGS